LDVIKYLVEFNSLEHKKIFYSDIVFV